MASTRPKASNRPLAFIDLEYDAYAREYLRNLPLEHFMEATPQAQQRKITLASLDLLEARRPDVQVFNELLVQYPRPRKRKPGQVVPDNMVVVCDQKCKAVGSFNLPVEPAGPFWVLEYVSKGSKRKDYDDNFKKYERELQVPYYLIFYPDTQDLTLYRHNGKKYVSVPPDENDRHALPELDLEVGLLDGWVRYWYQGKLLPLPAQMQSELDEANRRAQAADQRAQAADQRAQAADQRANEALQQVQELQRLLEQERHARRTSEPQPPQPTKRPRQNGNG